MSEKHMQLCREAIARPGKPVGKGRLVSNQEADYQKAHPPELTMALWECYEKYKILLWDGNSATRRVESLISPEEAANDG